MTIIKYAFNQHDVCTVTPTFSSFRLASRFDREERKPGYSSIIAEMAVLSDVNVYRALKIIVVIESFCDSCMVSHGSLKILIIVSKFRLRSLRN